MVNKWLKRMQGWMWPQICLLCGDPAGPNPDFCKGCAASLPWLGPCCRHCANALPVAADSCGTCQQQAFAFERVHACFRYRAPIDTLIHQLKYGRKLSLARTFGKTWAEKIRNAGEMKNQLPDLLVPVPLHISRLRERGFNQSLEIARVVARQLDIRLAVDALTRVRATAPQASLATASRARNVRNAFRARYPLRDKRIALIDDVMTTGHTANAAARAALEAGARSVSVWVLARA